MKKVVRLLVVLGLTFLAGIALLSGAAGRYVTVERLVESAETEINSRVQIGAVEVSLFQIPAKIVLRDVILAPRDGEIGKPYATRQPLTGGPVQVREVRLAVSLHDLLRRRLEVKEFVFDRPRLEITLDEDGENSLDELLRSPDGEKRETTSKPKGGGESLNIHEQRFLARLDGVRLQDAEVDLVITKTNLRVRLRSLDARLDAIEVDPSSLGKTNEARLLIAARVEVESAAKGLQYAVLDLGGPATVKLFNPGTGDLDPDVAADLALGDDSHLNAEIPAVQKAWRALQKLEKVGIKLGDLPPRAEFGRSRSIAVHYFADRVTLEKPLSVWFDDWELAVVGGTWVQTETEAHAGSAELLASERLSGQLRGKMAQGIDYVPKELRPEVVAEVEKTWFRDGRLVAEIVSAGELSDPDVTVLNTLPDVKEIARQAAARYARERLDGFAEDLLKKLRDKE